MELGLTFVMLQDLTWQLKTGTYWKLIKEPVKRDDVPLHKEVGTFVKLGDEFKELKDTEGNTVKLTENAIRRYLSLGYIEIFFGAGIYSPGMGKRLKEAVNGESGRTS